jgi:hypothetical protein
MSSVTIVAGRVFQLGSTAYLNQSEYLVAYLDFLIAINDHNNLRVLFERIFALPANTISR